MNPLPQPHYQDTQVRIYAGDCLELMRAMDSGIANTCVTSPPYYGLRDYQMRGQLGLEKTPDDADGPRYRAIGNSMAVPVIRFIGERIQMVDDLIKAESK